LAARFLVIEGNVAAARERHRASFGMTPSQSYAAVLQYLRPGIACDVAFPADVEAELPSESALAGYAGVVLTGSALHAYHDMPEVTRQIALMGRLFAAGVPVFGSCWGLQIAAAAAGGVVAPNPLGREVGIARGITRTVAGRGHPMLAGRAAAWDAPAIHLDVVVQLPPDCDVLATNAATDVQALEIRHADGVFWGVQYHPEFSLAELAVILRRYREPLLADRFFLSEDEHARFVDEFAMLGDDPTRKDLAWRYGIGNDLLVPEMRLTEIANFMKRVLD
jgi:GMP synthase (glutamine-hydrolysing)